MTKKITGYVAFMRILRSDLLFFWEQRAQMVTPMAFFLAVVSLFPLATSAAAPALRLLAPGIIWVAALLAVLVSLEYLFRIDFEDGTLDALLLGGQPAPVLILAKISAHWLMTALPVLLLMPVAGLLLYLPERAWWCLWWSLCLGTPTLSLLAAVMVALTVGLRRGGVMVAVLVLPFYVPVLIFATAAVQQAVAGLAYQGPLLMLASFLLFALTLAPLACAAALRLAVASG